MPEERYVAVQDGDLSQLARLYPCHLQPKSPTIRKHNSLKTLKTETPNPKAPTGAFLRTPAVTRAAPGGGKEPSMTRKGHPGALRLGLGGSKVGGFRVRV